MDVRRSVPTLALAAALTAVVMGGVAAAGSWRDIPARVLMGDPAAILDGPFYLGAVTLLRTGLLAGTVAVTLVAARVLRRREGRLPEFLAAFGAFCLVLVLDDKFQGHEAVLGQIFDVPEPLTFAVMGAVALVGVVRYRGVVASLPQGWVLLAAFPPFAFAVVADTFRAPLFGAFAETTAEVAGIACLALFGIRTSAAALSTAIHATETGDEPTFDRSVAHARGATC